VVTNPFEDENSVYHVLINEEGQHSLWPSFVAVPDGWIIIHKSDTRAACLDFIEKNWTDMRPNSLIEAMNEMAKNENGGGNQPADTAKPETLARTNSKPPSLAEGDRD
jgi:MbtH protein